MTMTTKLLYPLILLACVSLVGWTLALATYPSTSISTKATGCKCADRCECDEPCPCRQTAKPCCRGCTCVTVARPKP